MPLYCRTFCSNSAFTKFWSFSVARSFFLEVLALFSRAVVDLSWRSRVDTLDRNMWSFTCIAARSPLEYLWSYQHTIAMLNSSVLKTRNIIVHVVIIFKLFMYFCIGNKELCFSRGQKLICYTSYNFLCNYNSGFAKGRMIIDGNRILERVKVPPSGLFPFAIFL